MPGILIRLDEQTRKKLAKEHELPRNAGWQEIFQTRDSQGKNRHGERRSIYWLKPVNARPRKKPET